MQVILSPDPEVLAGHLFGVWEAQPRSDPLRPECIVIQNRITEGWLRHQFLFDRGQPARQRVRANWNVQFVNVFVNDWLHRMQAGGQTEREAEAHPYAISSLQWRLYGALGEELLSDPQLKPLAAYLGKNAPAWRRFGLAATLANLFDTYQVHRPQMLLAWEKQTEKCALDCAAWQALLWRRLSEESEDSYLRAFVSMESQLSACGIREQYERVTVFGVSALPPVYLSFFSLLSRMVPVSLYLLDPCGSRVSERRIPGKAMGRVSLEGLSERELPWRNPLALSLGRAHASFLAEACSRAAEPPLRLAARDDGSASMLRNVRNDIFSDCPLDGKTPALAVDATDDDSIRIHICHSPLRELEVLRDHLLRWFSEDPALEPRHIQVLVTDMAAYAPHIDAVFGTDNRDEAQAVPYALADRFVLAANGAAQAFLSLLALPSSRFKASEVVDLLECDAVRARFGLETKNLSALRELVAAAGIRWGLDASQRLEASEAAFTPATTWRHGLDRLLLGYALGEPLREDQPDLVSAGTFADILPESSVNGNDAALLGALARFLERLDWARRLLGGRNTKATLAQWSARFLQILDTFFVNTNETFADLCKIRQELAGLGRKAEIPGLGLGGMQVEFEAVAACLTARLESAEAADALLGNNVVFSGLRLGAALPRRIVCVLGLGDGVFPRGDTRPGFDLIGRDAVRRNGDPSLRLSDRGAFLEALLAARERLHLSYVGRGDKENEVIPPSTVVSELAGYLRTRFQLPPDAKAWDEKTALACFETLHHLQAFHPDYFNGLEPRLFSCSAENLEGAKALLGEKSPPKPRGLGKPGAESPGEITIKELCNFFANPAKAYFTQTLRARFDVDADTVLPDTELFETDALESYMLNTSILAAMLSGDAAQNLDRLSKEMMQRGMLPLGDPGRAALSKSREDLAEFLEWELPEVNRTVRALLEQKKERVRIAVELGGGWTLTGRLDVCRCDGKQLQVAARFASLKAKDLLNAWLRHLALAAQGIPAGTLVLPKKQQDIAILPSQEPGEARRLLRQLLELLTQGRSAPLPFAPNTSLKYAESAGANPADPALVRAALEAAAREWNGSSWSAGECSDAYLKRAFGDGGPMASDGFHDCALRVFEELPISKSEPKAQAPQADAAAPSGSPPAPELSPQKPKRTRGRKKGEPA